MGNSPENRKSGISRRDSFKVSGLVLSGLALGAGKAQAASPDPSQRYTYFDLLPEFHPGEPLAAHEMRISFMGSCIPPSRRAQAMMSVFVEVGSAKGKPDQFIFDCGSGVCANYSAMNVGFDRMDKVFVNHLHADHMSDLSHIYCFGPSVGRKSPLFVWGPGPSGVKSPMPPRRLYDDGTKAFCQTLREAMRWHSESFSFQTTSYKSYEPPTRKSWGLPVDPRPVGDDDLIDGYALVPIELDWTKYGAVAGDNVAYNNPESGVITHFPVIHCRKGSVGYKLEWNGLTMIYTSDTKPEYQSISQAINQGKGVDVFIHEMIIPAEVWAMKQLGITDPSQVPEASWLKALNQTIAVQNSSHTPQGAFGYILSQIKPRPRLTVATHFPVSDETVASALTSVRAHCPDVVQGRDVTWSADLMVINVSASEIRQRRGVVSDYTFSPTGTPLHTDSNVPKYHTADGNSDAFAQIDTSTAVPATDPITGAVNYREDGY